MPKRLQKIQEKLWKSWKDEKYARQNLAYFCCL